MTESFPTYRQIGTPRDRCGPPLSSNESSPCSLPRSPSDSSEPVGRVLGIDAHHCPRVPRQHGLGLFITRHRGLLTAAVTEWSQAFCVRASPERPPNALISNPHARCVRVCGKWSTGDVRRRYRRNVKRSATRTCTSTTQRTSSRTRSPVQPEVRE
jgi:hypothetical protein